VCRLCLFLSFDIGPHHHAALADFMKFHSNLDWMCFNFSNFTSYLGRHNKDVGKITEERLTRQKMPKKDSASTRLCDKISAVPFHASLSAWRFRIIFCFLSSISAVQTRGQYIDAKGVLHSSPPGNPYWQQVPLQQPYVPALDPSQRIVQEQYDNATKAMGYTPPPTQEQILQNLENARRGQSQKAKWEQQLEEVYRILGEEKITAQQLEEADPKTAEYAKYHGCFTSAAAELIEMLDGRKPLSLKRAVFLSENPSQGNALNYAAYCTDIQRYVHICKEIIAVNRLNPKDKDAKNWAIQRLYADTVRLTFAGKKQIIYPFTYDFEDYSGRQDIRKLFVTKLLKQHSGQCHSMPLLYAILAQELHTDAFIAYSPSHSYIMFKDKKAGWHNFETTCGIYTSPTDLLASGYIKGEAVENGLYLRPTTLREMVASCLADLITTYQDRFGNDDFISGTVAKILAYYPHHTAALMIRSNFITADMRKKKREYSNPNYADLDKYPDLKAKVVTMKSTYDAMDNLGFADMPDEAYQAWLKSIDRRKGEQEKQAFRKIAQNH
jgi:hypothetical protein